MEAQILRLECLKLAKGRSGQVDYEKDLEVADAYFDWVKSDDKKAPSLPKPKAKTKASAVKKPVKKDDTNILA